MTKNEWAVFYATADQMMKDPKSLLEISGFTYTILKGKSRKALPRVVGQKIYVCIPLQLIESREPGNDSFVGPQIFRYSPEAHAWLKKRHL